MGSLLNKDKKSVSKKVNKMDVSYKTIVSHKAKVLSTADIVANRSNAYSYLPL